VQVILPPEIDLLSLLPGSKNLTGANIELAAPRTVQCVCAARWSDQSNFDLIILDCPPALDLLTLNVLAASDTLIVPMQAEYFALRASRSWFPRSNGSAPLIIRRSPSRAFS